MKPKFEKIHKTLVAVFALSSMFIGPQSSSAQSSVNEGKSASSASLVHIRLQSGSVVVSGWEHDSVHVSGRMSPGETWSTRVEGDTVWLRADGMPRGLAAASDLIIHVPSALPLIIRAAGASLVVRGFDSGVDVATAAGNLLVESISGAIRAETMQGSLRVIGPSPRVEASTGSGDLLVSAPWDTVGTVISERSNSPFGQVIIRSVSGSVTFNAASVDSAEIHTVRGEIRVGASPSTGGVIRASSYIAPVTLAWREGEIHDLDVRTIAGGVRGRVYATDGNDVDVLTLISAGSAGFTVPSNGGGRSGRIVLRNSRGDFFFEKFSLPILP